MTAWGEFFGPPSVLGGGVVWCVVWCGVCGFASVCIVVWCGGCFVVVAGCVWFFDQEGCSPGRGVCPPLLWAGWLVCLGRRPQGGGGLDGPPPLFAFLPGRTLGGSPWSSGFVSPPPWNVAWRGGLGGRG